ncbi:XdhC family protein [Emcibacter nanhaiensis]|uniref:XdhC family protein n=1 Tax=Emcibacter nanhaiensis TaxID=1505037 RepID=UPI0015E283A6|nr:XdhC family protein [Emcibacter nanhaiensis]
MPPLSELETSLLGARNAVAAFQERWDGKTPYVVATIIRVHGAAAAKPGDKAIITGDGEIIGTIGGGCLRGAVKKAAQHAIESGEPQFIRTMPKERMDEVEEEEGLETFPSSCPSKGEVEVFLEPVKPKPTLVVFGETELAHSLVVFGRALGFRSLHGESGGNSAATENFTLDDLAAGNKPAPDYIVVATQGVKDKAALEAAVKSCCPHVFFVASMKKAAFWKERLVESGISDQDLDRLISPAGLHIGARGPAEIAVSILAQVIQIKNEKKPSDDS